jgi:type I restriction enzyme S subunit
MCSDRFQGELRNFASGSAQPQIPITDLRQVSVPVPPLPTQRKIAAILSAYDDLIENNLRRIKILEGMAQNLYREWFVKFRFPGHQHARFVDSSLGRIPEGWVVKRLDQVVLFQNKGTAAGEHLSDRVYLPIDCIPRKSLAISEINTWREAQSSLHLFDEGDILFGAMRPYFHKVVVAPFKGVTRKTCFVFKSWLPEYHAFAALTLFQDSTVSFANAHSKGATIPYAVWPQSMDCMPVIVPANEQAKRFEDAVGPMIARIGTMFFQNTTLRRTRDLLLPKLISGDVDVSELEIAVPSEADA